MSAETTQEIPLFPYTDGLYFMPSSNPHTPDPDDPNQFRATLTGNTLSVYQESTLHTEVQVVNLYTQTVVVHEYMRDSLSVVLRESGHYSVILGGRVPLIGHFTIFHPLTNADLFYVYSAHYVRSVDVVDSSGRMLIHCRRQVIDLSELPRGLYIIRVQTDASVESYKIMRL